MTKIRRKIIYRKSSQQGDRSAESQASKGRAAAFFTLDDGSAKVNLALFDKDYKKCADKLSHESVVVVGAYRTAYDIQSESDRWRASHIMTVEEAQQYFAKNLRIVWDISTLNEAQRSDGLVDKLNAVLQPFIKPSGCRVYISFRNADAETRMALSESCKVEPCEQLFANIKSIPGIEDVTVEYNFTH